MVVQKVFHFVHQKNYEPNKQTTWITNHLLGIGWSSGKHEGDRIFDVFHDINSVKAEMFVKGLESCKLVSRLLGRNEENLDDYGCP